MFFDRLDERNAMVKSVSHFDNFTKMIIFCCQRKEKRGTCSEQRGAFQWHKGEEKLEQGLYRERDDEFGRDSELGSRTSIAAVG